MEITKQDQEALKNIAKSRSGEFLIEYVERMKDSVADIRNNPEFTNEARVMFCKVIDEYLSTPLGIYSGKIQPPEDDDEWV